MTPNRARGALRERVLVDEGTPFEREGVIVAVSEGFIAVGGRVPLEWCRWTRVSFAPGRFTEADVAVCAAMRIKAVAS